jgi:hypothetical protein
MPKKPKSVTNKELANKIVSRYTTARNWREPLKQKWDDYYDLYRGVLNSNTKATWQAQIFVPYVFSTIETIVPRIVAGRPKINVIAREEGDSDYAKVQGHLLDFFWDQMKMDEQLADIVRQMLIYGTSVVKLTWDKKIEEVEEEIPVDANFPELGQTSVEVEQIVENHPTVEMVDLYDFFWDPKGYDIDTCAWVAHRTHRSYDYLLKMQKQGLYKNITLLEEMKHRPFQGESDKNSRHSVLSTSDPNAISGNSDKEANIELIEYWEDNRVITIANRKIVIRDEKNPFAHGKKPFVRFVDQSLPKEFCGVGEVEPIETLQKELNDMRNQRMDNASLILNRMWLVANGANVDENELVSDVGGIIHTDKIEGVQPLYAPEIPNSSYREETLIKADIQQTTGITDYTKGVASDALANETATGISMMQEAGNARLKLKMMNIEAGIRQLGQLTISLSKQFITEEMAIRILGDGEVQWLLVKPDELKDNFDLIVEAGPRLMENDAIAKRQALELFQMFAGDPLIDQLELRKYILQSFNAKNINKLLGQAQQPMAPEGDLGQVPLTTPPGGVPGISGQADLNQMGIMQDAMKK